MKEPVDERCRIMLLDTLNALIRAGTETLETLDGLAVTHRDVCLVREGQQTYPSLVTLRLKGCPLQVVHLGCDESLVDQPAGLHALAEDFLARLVKGFDDRNPRGTVESLNEASATLQTRGVRTFQFGFDTAKGRLSLLAEVPSRAELALAKKTEFLTSMEAIYLPADWRNCQELTDAEVVDDFLTYLRKTEGDIYLETPAGDGTATINSGLLVEECHWEDRPVLKLITDFLDPSRGIPAPGSAVKACLGIGDRSLEFTLVYHAPATVSLTPDTPLSCALFARPAAVTIGQRRQAFRVSIAGKVPVEMVRVPEDQSASAGSCDESTVIAGRLADLSFSGARIIADHPQPCASLGKDLRVECRLRFPDMEEPLKVMGIIRRLTTGPAEEDQWRDDLGVEFLVPAGGDRTGLDYIRQFVLEVQRKNLAQRLQVTNV